MSGTRPSWIMRVINAIRFFFIAFPHIRIYFGIPVVVRNTRRDISSREVLRRLYDALALIDRYQPWRLEHIRRDARGIWVIRYPTRGAYQYKERSIITELTFLARRDIGPETVASSIVHEGIHARVDRMLGRQRVQDLPREERLCRRAELEFGQSLPPEIGRPVIERAVESLALSDEDVAPSIDWAEAYARQNEIDRSVG